MTYRKNVLRPGMTAIAAVLALSSTQSFAQDAATATDAPPVPVAVPEPVAEPVSAPEPVATETVTPAPEQSTATVAQPVTQRRAPAASAAPVRRATAPVRSPAISAAAAAPAPTAAVDAPAATPAPIAAESSVPPPIPVQQVATPQAEAAGDDIVPIAAGAGALALIGGAFALSRRRRHRDDVAYEPETVDADHVAAVEHEPAPVMPVAARAAPAVAADPADSDLSRYGRHTQAAYRGPTPDNPSLSLKRRLKRAAFFDRREQMAGETTPAFEPALRADADDTVVARVDPPMTPPVAPAFAPRRGVRPTSKPLFGFQQPAFQS